jgi:hypothetical protein
LKGADLGQLGELAAAMCSIKAAGMVTVGPITRIQPDPSGPMVPCDGWLGLRPPSDEEWRQIQACARYWANPQAIVMGSKCWKSNYTIPAEYQNFYRDDSIEKLYSMKTGLVLVVQNKPTWLSQKLDWVLKNCSYAAIGAGLALGPGAATAVTAGCAIAAQSGAGGGTAPSGGGTDTGPPPASKPLSTGAKVMIGAAGLAVAGGLVTAIVLLAKG